MIVIAAAFARLCVETVFAFAMITPCIAAAFARLCVETSRHQQILRRRVAAAFARLCVETIYAVIPKIC